MKTIKEAAHEYAESQGYDTCDYVTKKDFEEYARIDFYAGVEFAQRWIPIEEEMPDFLEHERCLWKNENEVWFGSAHESQNPTHWRPIEIK